MPFFRRAPLWRQLMLIWVAAGFGMLLLFRVQWLSGSHKFFYLLPYPSSLQSSIALVTTAFRVVPLLAAAVCLPLIALLMTVVTIGARRRTRASSISSPAP